MQMSCLFSFMLTSYTTQPVSENEKKDDHSQHNNNNH